MVARLSLCGAFASTVKNAMIVIFAKVRILHVFVASDIYTHQSVCYDKKVLPSHLKHSHRVDHKFEVIEVILLTEINTRIAIDSFFCSPYRCLILREVFQYTMSTDAWAARLNLLSVIALFVSSATASHSVRSCLCLL